MLIYEKFLGEHGPARPFGAFSDTELDVIRKRLPEPIAGFLEKEGRASYAQGFFWTTCPTDHDGVLAAWGIKGKQNAIFMRTAFGACLYWNGKQYFYFDPIVGRVVSLDDDAYLIINYSLRLESILDHGFFRDQYLPLAELGATLTPSQILGFAPAIGAGGSFERSKVDVVDMNVHLHILAQLMGKARRVRL